MLYNDLPPIRFSYAGDVPDYTRLGQFICDGKQSWVCNRSLPTRLL